MSAARPQIHFTVREGWINDPLGLTWHEGEYHLFFQFVPGQTVWGPEQRWGHATSEDLLHWTEGPVALEPGDGDDGVWSGSVVVPPGLDAAWLGALGAEVAVRRDDPPLTHADLDGTGAVLTACRVAVAETGTIVLDAAPDQGRRALTLLPDRHVCVVRADQVVAGVPDAVALLGAHPERPLTWVSGPSATSDIELVRVEGVHGPRDLRVLLVAG
jgi:L-lactate dehydrogenase complex protein LldG